MKIHSTRVVIIVAFFILGLASDHSDLATPKQFVISSNLLLFLSLVFLGTIPFGIFPAVIFNSKHKTLPSLSLPLFKHQSPLMFPLMTSTVIVSAILGMLIRSLYYDTDKYEILILVVAAVGLFSATKLGEKILIKRYGK